MSATEVMDQWLARRDAADRITYLRGERARLQAIANGNAPYPAAENGPGTIVGLYERLDDIQKEIEGLLTA